VWLFVGVFEMFGACLTIITIYLTPAGGSNAPPQLFFVSLFLYNTLIKKLDSSEARAWPIAKNGFGFVV
jgi:hypothetical protein